MPGRAFRCGWIPALKAPPMTTMLSSDLPLPKIGRGKVRDIYAVDDDRLLLVTTDRISAFDVVMGETIPMKGAVLTQISAFWFNELEGVVPHHMIIADTKFEFGRDNNGRIILIDEVMTPDSSRFWATDAYKPGQPQASFDKQPLRDYLDIERRAGRWNGDAPPPPLPASVVEATST